MKIIYISYLLINKKLDEFFLKNCVFFRNKIKITKHFVIIVVFFQLVMLGYILGSRVFLIFNKVI